MVRFAGRDILMSYVNVGAYVDGKRPATKAALKRALAENPASVEFDGTSPLGPQYSDLSGVNVPEGVSLTVVGPDPFTSRKFYATVKINARTGKVVLT
jgi:hypothetical protein